MRALRRLHGHGLVWLVLGLAGAACRRDPASDVSDSTFVAAMADLRRVQYDTASDSASRTAARQRVLQRRGLTAERLERAARALAADPERATKVFQAIARKNADQGGPQMGDAVAIPAPTVGPPGAPPPSFSPPGDSPGRPPGRPR